MAVGCSVFWTDARDVERGDEVRLSEIERRRANGFRFESDRRRFVAGAVLLRAAVARVTGLRPADVTVERGCPHCGSAAHGRPTVVRPRRHHVSVTHAGELVGVAVCAVAPVGIDVEQVTEIDRAAVIDAMLAPGDRSPVTTAQVLDVWTAKEAALKALGRGFACPPDELRVQPVRGDRVALLVGREQFAARLRVLQPPVRRHTARLMVLTAEPVTVEERFVALRSTPVRRSEERCRHGRSSRRRGDVFPPGRCRGSPAFAAARVHGLLPEGDGA